MMVGKRPEWLSYIRVYETRALGTNRPPRYIVCFGPRNRCVEHTDSERAEHLAENIRNWILQFLERNYDE